MDQALYKLHITNMYQLRMQVFFSDTLVGLILRTPRLATSRSRGWGDIRDHQGTYRRQGEILGRPRSWNEPEMEVFFNMELEDRYGVKCFLSHQMSLVWSWKTKDTIKHLPTNSSCWTSYQVEVFKESCQFIDSDLESKQQASKWIECATEECSRELVGKTDLQLDVSFKIHTFMWLPPIWVQIHTPGMPSPVI